MSWLYSQALVEEYLAGNFSDGEQSAPSNGSHTQQAYCAPDKMTGFSSLSRFGMTYKPLTENHGKALLMSYLEDFRVKTLVQQEKAQELKVNDQVCGEKWHASFAKFDQDSSLWKTAQCSLLGGLELFSETWPQWGLMRDGECWEQLTLEQNTRETEFGLSLKWPTPTCQDANKATKKWRKNHHNNLTAFVFNLDKMFPTPTTRDYKGGYKTESLIRKDGKSRAMDALPNAVLNGKGTETATGHLNPTWVEWLMGWPLGWTDLKPLATDKSPCVQQQHGISLVKEFND